jgi:hypothetical protein
MHSGKGTKNNDSKSSRKFARLGNATTKRIVILFATVMCLIYIAFIGVSAFSSSSISNVASTTDPPICHPPFCKTVTSTTTVTSTVTSTAAASTVTSTTTSPVCCQTTTAIVTDYTATSTLTSTTTSPVCCETATVTTTQAMGTVTVTEGANVHSTDNTLICAAGSDGTECGPNSYTPDPGADCTATITVSTLNTGLAPDDSVTLGATSVGGAPSYQYQNQISPPDTTNFTVTISGSTFSLYAYNYNDAANIYVSYTISAICPS